MGSNPTLAAVCDVARHTGHLHTENGAGTRWRLVVPLTLQQIGSVDARRRDLDQHLVRSGVWGLDIPQLEHVRRPRFTGNYRFHSP